MPFPISRLNTLFIEAGLWISRLFSFLFFVWLLGFLGFFFYVYTLKAPSIFVLTDSIVLFTGGHGRKKVAFSVFDAQEKVPLLHLSGVHSIPEKPLHQKVSYDTARDTLDNIKLTRQWMQDNNVYSVRLVTSNYHMPRCLLLARRYWPKEVLLLAHPVREKGWLFFRGCVLEYNKCLLYWLGIR